MINEQENTHEILVVINKLQDEYDVYLERDYPDIYELFIVFLQGNYCFYRMKFRLYKLIDSLEKV